MHSFVYRICESLGEIFPGWINFYILVNKSLIDIYNSFGFNNICLGLSVYSGYDL